MFPQKNPNKRAYKGPKKGQLSGNSLGANPGDFWDGNLTHKHNNSAEGKEKAGHPCPFKDELCERIINLTTMPGDLILAPYSGHGTAETIAEQNGRLYAGCDVAYTEQASDYIDSKDEKAVHWLTGVPDRDKVKMAASAVDQLSLV